MSRFAIGSIAKTADGNHIDPIAAPVSIITSADKNHRKRGRTHFIRVNFCGQSGQRLSPLFNERVSAQLDLNQSIGAVAQVNNSIAL